MGIHVSRQYRPSVYVAERYLDLRLPAFAHTTGALPFSIPAITIPAETIVLNVGYETIQVSTGTGTGAVADAAANLYVTARALSTSGYATLATGGRVYGAQSALNFNIATVVGTDAIVRVFATLADVEDRPRPVAAS
jgi:hypothetical protein